MQKNNVDLKNHIIECSISHCAQQNGYSLIYMEYGNCGIFSSNISKNDIYIYSGFQIQYANGISKINFSTFEGNKAKFYICLGHDYRSDGSFEDYKCNIVNNKQTGWEFGTLFADSVVYVKNCTILGEYGNGKPFSKTTRSFLYIINCCVDFIEIYANLKNEEGTFSTSNIINQTVLNTLPHCLN